jgi:hypothetical protein
MSDAPTWDPPSPDDSPTCRCHRDAASDCTHCDDLVMQCECGSPYCTWWGLRKNTHARERWVSRNERIETVRIADVCITQLHHDKKH